MRRIVAFVVAVCAVLSAFADERGVEVLQRVGRRYSALNSYSLAFDIKLPDNATSGGVLSVSSNKLYMKMADNEIFVEDSVRYEVHSRQREIIVDRVDAYDKESFNPLKGVEGLLANYNVEYVEAERVLRLAPKSGGSDTLNIYIGVDGESVERVTMGKSGVTVYVGDVKYTQQQPMSFDRSRYVGFEIIDFR